MLLLAVLTPFLAAALVPVLYRGLGGRIGYLVALVPAGLFTYFAALLPAPTTGAAATASWDWVPQLGVRVSLAANGFSLFFALLITGIGLLVVAYATAYLGRREDLGKFYTYLLLFMGAMLGVALADHLIAVYVFWELTSVSSFLLIGFWYTRSESSYGALKSLLITVTGGLAMLAGFVLLSLAAAGSGAGGATFDLAALLARREAILASPLAPWALVLILAGAFTKSAQAPFHIWLPDAMAAPTPVSAYLHSATMVKAGLILVAKIWAIYHGFYLWTPLVTGVGLATMLLGGFLAITKTDLKAILALSTVSQLGLMMAALGLGTRAGVVAAVVHILNHAAFKGSLFMTAGIIDHETGTRDIRRLSGLARYMPMTATVGIIGALANAGLPLLNGFVSKELFFAATLGHGAGGVAGGAWSWLVPAAAVVGSIFTMAYSLVLAHRVFFGPEPVHLAGHPHEPPIPLWLPPAVLATWVLLTGLFPGLPERMLLAPAVAAVAGEPMELHLQVWHGFNMPLLMSLVAVAGGGIIYAVPRIYQALAAGVSLPVHANAIYDWAVNGLETGAKRLTWLHMTGLLRDYLVYALAATLAAVAGGVAWAGGLHLPWPQLGEVQVYEVALVLVMMAAALVTALARNRLVALVALGLVGAGITLLWTLLRAPDLALTQLVIEAVTTVLLLLVFARLPQLRDDPAPAGARRVNVGIAALAGLMATAITVLAIAGTPLAEMASPGSPSLKDYFLQTSYAGAGGKNVVNVIIVDFRGFDTMGETTVLGIAALAVLVLIGLRKRARPPEVAGDLRGPLRPKGRGRPG